MAIPILEAKALTRILPGPAPVVLVGGVDLAVAPGEFLAVTGPSGSGKSSLLYLLGLLDRPTEGTVLIEGRDTADLDDDALARLRLARLGFVFQFHFLLPEFTVAENVRIPMRRLGRLGDREECERVGAILASLDLGSEADKLPSQLSGGQRQRAAIARALANDPSILLADEPTGNLDSRNAGLVVEIFAKLAAEGDRAVVTVTHDAGFSARANRRITLVDGAIAAEQGS